MSLELAKNILAQLESKIMQKYEIALEDLAKLRYVYDADAQMHHVSGKIEAYEDITLMIKEMK